MVPSIHWVLSELCMSHTNESACSEVALRCYKIWIHDTKIRFNHVNYYRCYKICHVSLI